MAPPPVSALLSVRDVTVRFGGIVALDSVSFEMAEGAIVGLIGPNGAGKTTFFNCLSRLYAPDRGDILFEGRSVLDVTPHRIAELGIGRTFQSLALFGTMTVLQNVMVGVHSRSQSDVLSNALRLPWVSREERAIRRTAMELLAFLDLEAVAHDPAAGLSFGTLKRVELARALAATGHRAARRAPHEPRHAGVRPGRSARLRPEDRGGLARGGAARPAGDPGVSWERELMPPLLEALGLEARYGWTKVLHDLRFSVEEGGITTILGANGAGKTTTLRAVCGMVKTAGEIRFDGRRIDGKATEDLVRLGIAHAPEGRGTFVGLTVEENLRLGAYARKTKASIADDLDRIYQYFPVLLERRRQLGGTLSGGEQQMLAIARALILRPRLLLLDEPSLGLAPLVVREIFRIVRTINKEQGVSVLLVEQNASMALRLADHAYLLETGRVVMSGPSTEVGKDDSVRRAYLGY